MLDLSPLISSNEKEPQLFEELKRLKPHESPCLIYETNQEWQAFVSAFIKTGLLRGEKCCYIFDTHSARQVRDALRDGGVNVAEAEASGCLIIKHGNKVNLKDDAFDTDNFISHCAAETEKALREG